MKKKHRNFLSKQYFLYGVIFLGFIIFTQQIFSESFTNTVNLAAAERSLERASLYLGEGLWEQALFESGLGASYDSTLADFSYIEAVSMIALKKPRLYSLEKLETALVSGLLWRKYNKKEAEILCAQLYAETLQYNDALALLESVGPYPSADVDYIKAWCFFAQGKNTEAIDVISTALDRWPFDYRFPRLFLEQAIFLSPNLQKIKLADSILNRLYIWEKEHQELLLLSVPFEIDQQKRIKKIQTFRNLGVLEISGDIPFFYVQYATILALEYGIISDVEAVNEIFSFKDKGILLQFLLDLASLAVSKESRQSLLENITSFSGFIVEDTNKDGILDVCIEYRYGRPYIGFFDTYQDGIGEYQVECNFGEPQHIIDFKRGYTVSYDLYPSVKTVFDTFRQREYIIKPQSILWAPVRWQEESLGLLYDSFFSIKKTYTEPVLTETLLMHNTSYFTEPDPQNIKGIIRYMLENGIPISSEARDENGKYKYTHYLHGFPSVTYIDRDGDGYFETIKYYNKDGSLKNIYVDTNKNKTAEYRETWNSDGSILYEWDSNEDGQWELSWQEGPGPIGIARWIHPETGYQVSVETQNGLPRSLHYNGKTQAILKDPEFEIWWVGNLPLEANKISKAIIDYFNLNEPSIVSGMITVQSQRIFVVRTGGFLFADLFNE